MKLSKMQDRSEFDGKGNLFKSAAIRHKFENLVLFSYSRMTYATLCHV